MKWKPPSLTNRLGTHKIGRQIRHSMRQAVRILMLLCLMHICLSILTTALYHLTHACSAQCISLRCLLAPLMSPRDRIIH